MFPNERNPQFTNPLYGSASPYLKQHAHNPVFWYPWGAEAHARARAEDKPILLSIGYSTCYWCHVMEREVFENPSIAALMNQHFINIKVDREEHPHIDEIYMVARQLLTNEGGWPNNVILTPELKPFYAGGTYGPKDAYNKPGFPHLVEWIHYVWTTQRDEAKDIAERVTRDMRQHLIYAPVVDAQNLPVATLADNLFGFLNDAHDERSGGFFQAPKFPREQFLSFLLSYYERSGKIEALDIVARTVGKMASGGINDQVGGGFHRYAIDKEWYIPHFEKMLYTQAQMARVCLDAGRLTSNSYFADVAKSILDFVSGPLTSPDGAFYAAIDAESDGVEGQYYAWEPAELQKLLLPEEVNFFTEFFALADIPTFPGHKHTKGQVLIARKPLFQAALERNMPYVAMAARTALVMNKLLAVRNQRNAPGLDDKIIISWNGLMIDAFAHAGMVFKNEHYTKIARRAADYLLANARDAQGRLYHTLSGIPGMLEDYAYLIKGLITLLHSGPDMGLLEKIRGLMRDADALFLDGDGQGYYSQVAGEAALFRIKNADDSALPNANAVMLNNLVQLHAITKDDAFLTKAKTLAAYFLGGNSRMLSELATMIQSALLLERMGDGKPVSAPTEFSAEQPAADDDAVQVAAALWPEEPKPGNVCELVVTLDIKEGWHINAAEVNQPYLIPTQFDVQGEGVELLGVDYPPALGKAAEPESHELLQMYYGKIILTARLKLAPSNEKRPKIKVLLRFQPCSKTACYQVRDVSLFV